MMPSLSCFPFRVTGVRANASTIAPAIPIQLKDEIPADAVFAVVVTVTVAVAVEPLLKSTVY